MSNEEGLVEAQEVLHRQALEEAQQQIRAYEKNWVPRRDFDAANAKHGELGGLLDRALREVANRDAQLRGQDLTIAHLQGQIAALTNVFAMGQQAAASALYGPQVTHELQEFKLDGLEEMPPRREEPAVVDKITSQLKAAGIDTSARCGYEWDTDDEACSMHACGVVNPLHVGDHQCEQGCGTTCSQQEAERIAQEADRAT